ncbi:MAG: helix-turn-helix domain-containing protein [Firmicutes bacterium]|nr:helix-turn-helix domain-containing protein [Bacillota bacterium]
MTLNAAVARRVAGLLEKHGITQYRLVVDSGLTHSAMRYIMSDAKKDVRLSTIAKICTVFNMTLDEFFNDKVFNLENIDFD